MPAFEYKVVPAPRKGQKFKGVKGTEDRYAKTVETVMNDYAADGWEYLRADVLPSEERSGLTGRTTVYQTLLVFRRALQAEAASPAPHDAPADTAAEAEAPRIAPTRVKPVRPAKPAPRLSAIKRAKRPDTDAEPVAPRPEENTDEAAPTLTAAHPPEPEDPQPTVTPLTLTAEAMQPSDAEPEDEAPVLVAEHGDAAHDDAAEPEHQSAADEDEPAASDNLFAEAAPALSPEDQEADFENDVRDLRRRIASLSDDDNAKA